MVNNRLPGKTLQTYRFLPAAGKRIGTKNPPHKVVGGSCCFYNSLKSMTASHSTRAILRAFRLCCNGFPRVFAFTGKNEGTRQHRNSQDRKKYFFHIIFFESEIMFTG
jgi:hypothetical protein